MEEPPIPDHTVVDQPAVIVLIQDSEILGNYAIIVQMLLTLQDCVRRLEQEGLLRIPKE